MEEILQEYKLPITGILDTIGAKLLPVFLLVDSTLIEIVTLLQIASGIWAVQVDFRNAHK